MINELQLYEQLTAVDPCVVTLVSCSPAGISSFTIQPVSVVVTQGSIARLSCKISAQPPPIITWEFNRVTLPLATER